MESLLARAEEREAAASPEDSSRGSPPQRRDVLRLCSACGSADCGALHCRLQHDDSLADAKPVLKFSVSAILGTDSRAAVQHHGEYPLRTYHLRY